MNTQDMNILASDLMSHPLSRGISDCEKAGEMLFDAAKEIDKLRELLDEQKGTITALNIALGGEGSTSTENLIDAHDLDRGDQGLISAIRNFGVPQDQLKVGKEDHPSIADCIIWSEIELAWIRAYGKRCYNAGIAKGMEAGRTLFDCQPQAHRLALELECLLLDTKDMAAVSKWWDSANEALEQWREYCADGQKRVIPLGID